jgi:hypothetical protein
MFAMPAIVALLHVADHLADMTGSATTNGS